MFFLLNISTEHISRMSFQQSLYLSPTSAMHVTCLQFLIMSVPYHGTDTSACKEAVVMNSLQTVVVVHLCTTVPSFYATTWA